MPLTKDNKEIILQPANDTEKHMFVGWKIEENTKTFEEFYKWDIPYFKAVPIIEEKKDHILTFKADSRSKIKNTAGEEVSYIRKPYKNGEDITKLFPSIDIMTNYNGKWTISEKEVNKETTIQTDAEMVFLTYQDMNNNKVDDLSETFTIKFVSELPGQEFTEKKVKWNETINLPIPESEEYVFFDWYIDPTFDTVFTEETNIQKDYTLYAKNIKFSDLVNTTVENPIYREDLAEQIKLKLKKHNLQTDQRYISEEEAKKEEREAIKKEKEKKQQYGQEEVTFLQFHNKGHNKLYLITFIDPNSKYIYSIIAPYGQTIKIVNEDGKVVNEYSVRQNTTITLNEKKLLSGSELDYYHSEYREINKTVFIKIQPISK